MQLKSVRRWGSEMLDSFLSQAKLYWLEAKHRFSNLSLQPAERLALIDGYTTRLQSKNIQTIFWRGCPKRVSIRTESIIALALKLRGMKVKFIISDSAIGGCIQRSVDEDQPLSKWGQLANECFLFGVEILNKLGNEYLGMGKLVPKTKQVAFRKIVSSLHPQELVSYRYRDLPVGHFAKYSTLHYLKGLPLEGHESVLREYLFSALMCAEAANNTLMKFKPKHVFMQRHLEYIGWAPAYYLFTKAGVKLTLWSASPTLDGKICFKNVLGTDLSSIFAISEAAWKKRSQQALTKDEDKALDKLLSFPWKEGPKPENFHPLAKAELLQKLAITDKKPIWCMFLHVTYDAGLYPETMVFDDVESWTLKTITRMKKIRDVLWLIKVHPSERQKSVHSLEEVIKTKFPDLPNHIKIIPPDSDITTNDLNKILSGGITIQGTVGTQLPVQGIPVIVTGNTHYTNKGFTYDVASKRRYYSLLKRAATIKPLSDSQIDLARKYAYSLFFQRNFKLSMTHGRGLFPNLDPRKANLLYPGNDRVIDMICERIINGGEFILL